MKKSDIVLIVLAAALVAGMILTAILGRGSRHGYGSLPLPTNDSLKVKK